MKSLHLVLALAFFALNSFAQVVILTEIDPEPPRNIEEECMCCNIPTMPIFLGCEHIADMHERKKCSDLKMMEFVNQNLKYPAIARDADYEGKVFVRFVIEIDGSMSNIEVLKDMTPVAVMKEAAIEVMELMQKGEKKWIAASRAGKPERTRIVVPIVFKLKNTQSPLPTEK